MSYSGHVNDLAIPRSRIALGLQVPPRFSPDARAEPQGRALLYGWPFLDVETECHPSCALGGTRQKECPRWRGARFAWCWVAEQLQTIAGAQETCPARRIADLQVVATPKASGIANGW